MIWKYYIKNQLYSYEWQNTYSFQMERNSKKLRMQSISEEASTTKLVDRKSSLTESTKLCRLAANSKYSGTRAIAVTNENCKYTTRSLLHTLQLTPSLLNRLDAFQMRGLRYILGVERLFFTYNWLRSARQSKCCPWQENRSQYHLGMHRCQQNWTTQACYKAMRPCDETPEQSSSAQDQSGRCRSYEKKLRSMLVILHKENL